MDDFDKNFLPLPGLNPGLCITDYCNKATGNNTRK
jgi:hypothetical protein